MKNDDNKSMKFLRKEKYSGFTLIDVMIAVLISAVAISGLVFLIGTTGLLATSSRASKQAAEIASSEIERIRNMDFDSIGFPDATGNEPSGILPRQTTRQVGGITYTIKYEIVWVDDPNTVISNDYKKVRVIVNWSTPRPGKYSLVSYVSQASRRAPGRIIVPPPPELVSPPSPSPDSIVSGEVPIYIRVSEPNMLFSAIEIRIGGGVISEKRQIEPLNSYAELTYYWNTEDFSDGRYEISAFAYEARGGTNYRTWYYIVDNSPPTQTPNLLLRDVKADSVTAYWTTIYDGYEKVAIYEFSINSTNTSNVIPYTLLPTELSETTVSRVINLQPWTIYSIYVRGLSYGKYSPKSPTRFVLTKIKLNVSRQGNSAVLSWTAKPAWSIADKYEIWKKVGTSETLIGTVASSTNTFTVSKGYSSGVSYKVKAMIGPFLHNESDWVTIP